MFIDRGHRRHPCIISPGYAHNHMDPISQIPSNTLPYASTLQIGIPLFSDYIQISGLSQVRCDYSDRW